ncbi:MAG: penicillin amidase [Pseudomonadota bacterium]|nr:penicillin acylase family protein [Rubrivivax sp.]
MTHSSIARWLLAVLAAALAGCAAQPAGGPLRATLTRTAYGLPHVQADSDAGVGYGLGYSVAEDRLCDLMDAVLTVRGERARFLGADKASSYGLNNLRSDLFQKWFNDDDAVARHLAAQSPTIAEMLRGYAAGVNRYLRDKGSSARRDACRDAAWVRPIAVQDLARLTRWQGVGLGIGSNAAIVAVTTAAPPAGAGQARATEPQVALSPGAAERAAAFDEAPVDALSSNAAAFGRLASANGSGLLFANPHLPSFGSSRLSLLHVTRPGHYDVLGSAFVGMPFPTVGFNRHLAYTGTISQSQHLSYFALRLAPGNPLAYLVDGRVEAMKPRTLRVEAAGPDGRPEVRQHTIYETRYGPVFALPGRYAWTRERAFAIRDANSENPNLLNQLESYARSRDVAELHAAQLRLLGNSWLIVTAADDRGQAYHGNLTPVPRITDDMLARCVDTEFRPQLAEVGTYPPKPAAVVVLDGSRSDCSWSEHADAPRRGIFAGSELPRLLREDFVQNSNDSSWYTNPAAPLTGFAQVVSRERIPVWWRTSMGLRGIAERLQGGDGKPGNKMDAAALQALFYSFRVLAAEQHLDAILAACTPPWAAAAVPEAELERACAILRRWDRRADLDSRGYLLFERLWLALVGEAGLFEPFDAQRPLRTDQRLRSDDATRTRLRTLIADAVKSMRDSGIALDARLADTQYFAFGDRPIAWPGGPENTGIYNRVDAAPWPGAQPGRRRVVGGPTHVQIVGFGPDGPVNLSLLPIGQATDPARSPHRDDQAALFAEKQLVRFPFSAAEIAADAARVTVELQE